MDRVDVKLKSKWRGRADHSGTELAMCLKFNSWQTRRGRNFYFVVVCCCRSNPSPTPFTFNSLPELYEFIYIPPPPTLFDPPTPYNHQLELLACAEVLLLFVALLEVLLLPGQPAHRSNWHNLNNFHLDFPQKRRLRTWLWRLLINAMLWTSFHPPPPWHPSLSLLLLFQPPTIPSSSVISLDPKLVCRVRVFVFIVSPWNKS